MAAFTTSIAFRRLPNREAMKTMLGLIGETQRPVAVLKCELYKLPEKAGLLGFATSMTVIRFEVYALTYT